MKRKQTLLESGLTKRAEQEIERIVRRRPKARRVWEKLKDDPFIRGQWEMSDYIAVGKLHFSAHGDTHAKVVAANALRILEILVKKGVKIDTVSDGIGDVDDVCLIVLSSALLHDIGNQIHREGHYDGSVMLAIPILDKLLPEFYRDTMKLAQIRGSILHCIGTHMDDVGSCTLEASVVKIADGTDITKGRSRLHYDPQSVNIHTVSAFSIDDVIISEGDKKPVRIIVKMTNSAGIFQVQEILCNKIRTGVIGEYVEILASTSPTTVKRENRGDERIIHKVTFSEGRFVHDKE
jgi:metal-dependent HD superfamily phosphatase/phosphodiesterase